MLSSLPCNREIYRPSMPKLQFTVEAMETLGYTELRRTVNVFIGDDIDEDVIAGIIGEYRYDPSEQWKYFITCVFHNGRSYDFHLLIQQLH